MSEEEVNYGKEMSGEEVEVDSVEKVDSEIEDELEKYTAEILAFEDTFEEEHKGLVSSLRKFLDDCRRLERIIEDLNPISPDMDIERILRNVIMTQLYGSRDTTVIEPSETAAKLIEKVGKMLNDCRAVKAFLRGEKIVRRAEVKYQEMPPELRDATPQLSL